MAHDSYKSLYIHIPFCKKRCDYCDFCTEAVDVDSPKIASYVEDIVLELRKKGREGELSEIETIYIGGGTPSHITTKYLSQILYAIGITVNMCDATELSIEANPESIDDRLIKDIWALGVNRISIGVQSFDDFVLKNIGRIHSGKDAVDSVIAAADRFENISIDLMCGLPGQTMESFEDSLDTALSLPITHISIYPLSIEPKTPLAKKIRKGLICVPDEDISADMMELAAEKLKSGGFERYEVASYAKCGYECAHNISYWSGVPYLGIGKSAATMTQNKDRRMRIQDGIVTDDLNRFQMAAEDLMLSMRMSRGVSDKDLECHLSLLPDVRRVFSDLEKDGLVVYEDSRWKPTERGWLFGNELYGRIFDLCP